MDTNRLTWEEQNPSNYVVPKFIIGDRLRKQGDEKPKMDIKERIREILAGRINPYYEETLRQIVDLFELVTLEPLSDEEIEGAESNSCSMEERLKAVYWEQVLELHKKMKHAISQSTIAKNSTTQLYRIKMEESGNK